MSKRILSIMLVILMCISLIPLSAAAAGNVEATYTNGVVTVKGIGFTGGISYTVRVVDTVNSNVHAMGQTTANGSGEISISITTGVLETMVNYKVYINKPDGTLAGSDTSIEAILVPEVGGVTTPADTSAPDIKTDITNEANAATISASVNATADPVTGKAAVEVGESILRALTEKVKEAESSGKKAVVEIKVESKAILKGIELEIPRDSFNKIAGTTKADVKIDSDIGTITFSSKAVESISDAAKTGNISIDINKVEASALTAEVQAKIGDRPVYDFSVKAGSTEVSDFKGGNVSISLPYTLKPGEEANSIVVYYIDNSGKLNTIRGRFDPASGKVNFNTSHFSRYAVGYNKVEFNDVATNAWYNEAIGFMSARGIVKGVGGGMFAPENKVTRADFLIMVMNSYGIELDSTINDNFADAGRKYYTPYLSTAKHLGLVSGAGGNKYAPEAAISRQDMFVILYRALNKLNELPAGANGKDLGSFNDVANISDYAKDAIKLFIETGVVSGEGKKLSPESISSRAQAAQVLYNLLSK